MQDLSGVLSLFRRARVHLEQDPPAEPQSAPRPWASAPTGSRPATPSEAAVQPRRIGRGERAASHRRRHRRRRPRRSAPRKGASFSTGASTAFESKLLFAEGQTVGEAKVFGGSTSYVPLVGPGTVRVHDTAQRQRARSARIVYTGPVPAPVQQGPGHRQAQGLAGREPRPRSTAARPPRMWAPAACASAPWMPRPS